MTSPPLPPLEEIAHRLRTAGCVFAEDEAELLLSAAPGPDALEAMVDGRIAGRPLEHVVGWADFAGVRVRVDPGVFVPRRRSEFLISQAAALTRPGTIVVDLCCGSGALGAALSRGGQRIELHATDIDPLAVRCARHNVMATGGRTYTGDLYEPLPIALRGRIGVLLANVPYVPTDEIGLLPTEARLHEARVALDGGADGLDVLRRVAAEAPGWLAPGGALLFETSERQSSMAVRIAAVSGLEPQLATSRELAATVVIGTRQK